MMLTPVWLFSLLFATVTLANDMTLSPEAKGRNVVDAVVDRIRSKCIFSNDRLFLRRLAYVETHDGEDEHTYRQGYDGGIWQVDYQKLISSQQCGSRTIRECNIIQSKFGINWQQVKWADLRKPLYSGLAAAMFILTRMTNQIPGGLVEQARYWRDTYNSLGSTAAFVNRAEMLRDNVCTDNVIDLAFILDGSGSIMTQDFTRTLGFVKNVVSGLNVSSSTTRIAAVEFGTWVSINFNFNRYSTKSALLTAISNIDKHNGGTDTAAALGNVTSVIFNQFNGARPDAKRIAILLTDGVSINVNATINAAKALRSKGVTVFAIGVGYVNQAELMGVASEPTCTHMFLLDNFEEIDSLMYELLKSSCNAPSILGGNGVGSGGSGNSITREINDGNNQTTVVIPPESQTSNNSGNPEKVFKAEVECGSLQIYASYDTPNPGPAFFQTKEQATDGNPAILYFTATQEGKPLYITVIGTKLDSPDKIANCVSSKYTLSIVDKPKVQTVTRPPLKRSVVGSILLSGPSCSLGYFPFQPVVYNWFNKGRASQKTDIICRTAGVERPCSVADISQSILGQFICKTESIRYGSPINPCTPEAIGKDEFVHPHPSDVTKFIFCDVSGKMYITQCPMGEVYNSSTGSCNFGTVEVANGVPLRSDVTNPCTKGNLVAGNLYFPDTKDQTQFIQCDLFGRGWIKKCPPNQFWHQALSTCTPVHEDVGRQASVDPRYLCQASGEMYTDPTNPSKFIHCTGKNTGVIKLCPASLVFNQVTRRCDWA